MELNISTESLSAIQRKLLLLAKTANYAGLEGARTRLSAAFSQIPGLGFLAAEHGRTLAGNPGSAVDEFNALEQKIAWAANNLHNLADAVYEQDEFLSSSLTHMYSGRPGGHINFFTAAEPSAKSAPVGINSPAIGRVPDINLLASYFSSTVDSAAHHDADLWHLLGDTAAEISDGLEEVATELEANNYGESISAGAEKLRGFAETGRILNANSHIMKGTINNLANAIETTRKTTTIVQTTVNLKQASADGKAIEEAYLNLFPAQFSAALQPAVPRLLGLSIPHLEASGGENEAIAPEVAGSTAEQARNAVQLPSEVQQVVADYGPNQATFAAADDGAAQLSNVGESNAHTNAAATANPAVTNGPATGAGSHPAATNPVNAQHVGASSPGHGPTASPGLNRFDGAPSTMPANNSPNAGASRVLGAGNTSAPITTGAAGHNTSAVGGAGAANTNLGGQGIQGMGNGTTGNGVSRGGGQTGTPLGAGSRGINTPGLPQTGAIGTNHGDSFSARPIGSGGTVPYAGGAGGSGGAGHPGASGTPGAHNGHNAHGGLGANSGSHGSNNGAGNHGSSGNGSGNHSGHNPHGNSASGNGSSQSGHSSRSNSGHMGRGMMPMMGGAGQPQSVSGNNSTQGRAKAVTTAVEREGNQKALLGERRPVVPGVIGAWVRD